jgi:hypothetical protein
MKIEMSYANENIRLMIDYKIIRIVEEVLRRKRKLECKLSNVGILLRLLEKSESSPLLTAQEARAVNKERWIGGESSIAKKGNKNQ